MLKRASGHASSRSVEPGDRLAPVDARRRRPRPTAARRSARRGRACARGRRRGRRRRRRRPSRGRRSRGSGSRARRRAGTPAACSPGPRWRRRGGRRRSAPASRGTGGRAAGRRHDRQYGRTHEPHSQCAPCRSPASGSPGPESAAVTSPFDGEEIGRVPVCGPDDVDRAVRARRRRRWRAARCRGGSGPRCSTPPPGCWPSAATSSPRSSPGRRPSRSRRPGSRPSGPSARSSSPPPRRARWPATSSPSTPSPAGVGKVGFTMRVPIGVVGAISPFNFPLNLVAHKLAPAIAAGCPVVLKPASQTPFSGIALAELLIDECGLPAEWLHVVTGGGSTVGNALVDHDDIALITFTGSPDVGWGDQGAGAAEEGRPRARQQRPGDHRGRQRLDVGGGEDQGRRVLPRRAELHLDAAHLRPRRHRRRVRRDARQGGVVARRRRPDGRGDRRVGADLRGRARPGGVVGRRGRGRGRDGRPRRRASTTTACCCRPC